MYDYLEQNFADIEAEISDACICAKRERDSVTLITVTKTYPVSLLQSVLDLGHVHLGENRPQEIIEKASQLKTPPVMHLIGQLQTNKVRKVLPYVGWIHSVDRVKLLEKIDDVALECNTSVNILIQVNTSGEESKSGCHPDEAVSLCEEASRKQGVRFRGLMTIGPLHGDESAIKRSFLLLKDIADQVKDFTETGNCELSMGMSDDFALAIECGATMVRIGSRLVGTRSYA